MAKSEKRKSIIDAEEDEEKSKLTRMAAGSINQDDEDDAEANEDLTLKIVEKSLLMRNKRSNGDVSSGEFDVSSSSTELLGHVLPGTRESGADKRKRRRKAKKLENSQLVETPVNDTEKEEKVAMIEDVKKAGMIEATPTAERVEATEILNSAEEVIDTTEILNSADPNEAQNLENVVLRKLLRGPRYFDIPDGSWGVCYNCGEEGHMAVNCTVAKRKKPCFVCGSLDHGAKQCTKAQNCYICKQSGHRTKDCREKHKSGAQGAKICLKCGNLGHDMLSCEHEYSQDDLKEIQCYICKNLGHFCCANYTDTGRTEQSCYKCGQLGHTGLACGKSRQEANGEATPSSCYKCGKQGHFARECQETTVDASSNSCYKCGNAGHFARECQETTVDTSSNSCYKCGNAGHFARECHETAVEASPNSCYKCGNAGHFARECTSSIKVNKTKYDFSVHNRRHNKENRDKMGNKSASQSTGKIHKERRANREGKGYITPQKPKHRAGRMTEHPGDSHHEGRGYTTSHKSKNRGGWITEHPGDSHHEGRRGYTIPQKAKHRGGWMNEHPGNTSQMRLINNDWGAPATPYFIGHATTNWAGGGGYNPTSAPYTSAHGFHSGTPPVSRSYLNGHEHSFSASRFNNFNGGPGMGRGHDWW